MSNESAIRMFESSRNNFVIFEESISKELGRHVSSIRLVFSLLDEKYKQTVNGTKPCMFSLPNTSSNNFLQFSTQSYEPDEELYSFHLKDKSTLVVGCANMVLNNGTVMSCFNIVPTSPVEEYFQAFKLTSVYDNGISILVNVHFDKQKRIQQITFQNFHLDDHPNLKKLIVKNTARPYEEDHLKDTLKKMNELGLDRIIKSSPTSLHGI